MRTDIQFYNLFSELPEYLFDLTGIHSSSRYTLTSETVKEFSRSMDGLMKPDNPGNPHFIVKFQMQKDDTIYYRTVMEMASIGIKNKQNMKESLSDVFTSWMLIRFKNKSYHGVFKMLTLTTPLEETAAYKELVAIGKK